jgi:signal transduction histidine kinase/CheY-like chemotaxis protein
VLRQRRSVLAAWRGLPLTAQLLVVGMIFGLGWFLTARSASDRQQTEMRAVTSRLNELHAGTLMATRIGSGLSGVASDYRAYLLTGDTAFLSAVVHERLRLRVDLAELKSLFPNPRIATAVDSIAELLKQWEDSSFVPNVALRQRSTIAAFGAGSPAAAALERGARIISRAERIQEDLARGLTDATIQAELDVDRDAAYYELANFLIWTAALAVFLLVLTLLMRLVARALQQVVDAAEALDAGAYARARLPDAHLAPNREMAHLATTFEQLAANIERREGQLQQDIVQLRELERLKRDFVSTVSHELRTPLTSMRGALGLILGGKTGELPTKSRDLLQIAMSNTERLIRLINDILDIEKMDAGQISLRRDRLRLRPLLETTCTGLEAFAREHRASVRITSPMESDADVIGDPDRLIQVFTNLISNALKFSPSEGLVEIAIGIEDTLVRVRVRDHGPGIPPEFAERIFGRFQQAGGADSRKSGGTGLGLNIARGIVEMHSGAIGFEPADGGGTTFWVTLPVAAPYIGGDDARRVILIIEDDPSMRDVLVAQFESLARAIGVQSAEAGLEVLTREPVGAIVLDPGLPGMSGLEFARAIRQDPKLRTLPLFLFSAREHATEELRAAGIRASDAFVKTRDSEALLFDRVRLELQKRR